MTLTDFCALLDDVCDKHGRGFTPPEEKARYITAAQVQLWDWYMDEHQNRETGGRGYGSNRRSNDALGPFRKISPVGSQASIPRPADYGGGGQVFQDIGGTLKSIPVVTSNRIEPATTDPFRPNQKVAVQQDSGFVIYPAGSVSGLQLHYIAKPKDVVISYAIRPGGEIVINDTALPISVGVAGAPAITVPGSVLPDFDMHYWPRLAVLALQQMGLALSDDRVLAFADKYKETE